MVLLLLLLEGVVCLISCFDARRRSLVYGGQCRSQFEKVLALQECGEAEEHRMIGRRKNWSMERSCCCGIFAQG